MKFTESETVELKKSTAQLRWDNDICPKASIKDISVEKVKKFLKDAGLKYSGIQNALEKLGLTKNGNLMNTAILFFGKKPERFFPNAKLRCAVFGTTGTAYIIDRQEFTGDIFFLIEKAEEYILQNIHIGMKLNGMYRVDVPEISRSAFREAVINAFCHRDYHEYDSVNIAIFKDRMEIRNPGGLFGGLTIEQIKREMVSKRRNEFVAELFHRIHFVEKWGRGIDLILSEEPTTNFKEVADIFVTTFKRKNYEEPDSVMDRRVNYNTGNNTGNNSSKKTSKKTGKKTADQIIDLVKKIPSISIKELSESTGLSISGTRYHLDKLKKEGTLKRIGPDKGGYWEIIEKVYFI